MEGAREHPLDGAEFLHPHEEVNEEEWPREPQEYVITSSFRQRVKELRGIVDGDMINDAITYGELMQASEDCMAFVLFKEGFTISIIVDWDPLDIYNAVSVWPYIYDINKTRKSGQLSSKEIWRIEEYVGKHKSNWEEH